MRPIKFRVWDKLRKNMVLFDFNDIIQSVDCCVIIYGNDYYITLENNPIMQFTGLQNLYEGDKIKYDSFYTGDSLNNSGIGIIKFIEYGFAVYDENDEFITELFDLGYIGFEIIGNIYEH